MYEVQFDPDDNGRQRYEICHQAIVLSPRPTEVSDWDDVISLLRKIKSCGTPGPDKIGKTVLYEMNDEGGTMVLENSEMKQLLAFISQPLWRPETLENAQDTKKWLESLKKFSGSLKPDAKPEEKRRAIAGSIPQAKAPDGVETVSTPGDAS